MPGSYPPPPPTLAGDLETISRFLNSPTALQRRLRTFRDLRFVSDRLLTQRFRTSGGAVLYEMSEPFVTDRAVTAVGAGSEYPSANLPTGTAGIAAVSKWGQKVPITDEEITRNVYGGAAVDRNLRKVVNSIIKQVDSVTMSAIGSAVTQTFDVTASAGVAWTGATPTILRDILEAKAVVVGLNLGYMPDTLALNDTAYAIVMSDEKITNALRRETMDSPVYTGEVEVIAGLRIVVSPAITTPTVLDSTQLGGMADEQANAPGYAMSDLAVQVKSIRVDSADKWDLQGRRLTVPVVQEPGAAVELINTGV
ncbi:phage major capsid protein [Nonomuraea sp. 10N515B]|uniref:phage major capsid protein n=1 Tax=Nonomuraea sp. 10N515B TaxID=3457422 RepID=UPI003FCE3882